jgi:hypothetical protein
VLAWLSMSFREPKVQKSRQSATELGILVTLKERESQERGSFGLCVMRSVPAVSDDQYPG